MGFMERFAFQVLSSATATQAAKSESNCATCGSDSEDSTLVVIKCYTVGASKIGDCKCDRDASIGAFKHKLRQFTPHGLSNEEWLKNATFLIGQETYSFNKDYFLFMWTDNIRDTLGDKTELDCTIVFSNETPASN